MRQIGTLPDEAAARRMVDYLLTLDIPGRVNRAGTGDGWAVWVDREEQVERARAELAVFRADPADPRFRDVERAAQAKRREAERVERQHRKASIELGGRLNVRTFRRCPVTTALMAASLAVGVASEFGEKLDVLMPLYFTEYRPEVASQPIRIGQDDDGPEPEIEFRSAGLDPILHGQVWRLFTPMFIHYGLRHFVFNMMALWWLGGLIEMRKSWRLLAALVLVASPVSFFAQYYWDLSRHGPNHVSLPGGMSGVIYALFGYAWMKSDYEPESDVKIATNTIVWMMAWLFLCMTGGLGPIANAAHVAGLLFGLLAGVLPHLWADLRWR